MKKVYLVRYESQVVSGNCANTSIVKEQAFTKRKSAVGSVRKWKGKGTGFRAEMVEYKLIG